MKIKKISALVLSFILLMSISISALDLNNNSGDIYVAHFDDASKLAGAVAYEDIIYDYSLSYNITKDSIYISGDICGNTFSIEANLETISYNGDALVYFGEDAYQNYEVLTTHIIKRNSLSSFFENYSSDSYTDIIKVYLKDNISKEFIIIEIFMDNNFVERYSLASNLVFDSDKINESIFWFTKYLDSYEGNDDIETLSSTRTKTFKRFYDVSGTNFKFVLKIDVCYTSTLNLSKKGSGSVDYYFTVVESSVYISHDGGDTYEKFTTNQDEVQLQDLNITVAACPNIRFTSQTPIRSGLENVSVSFRTYIADVTAAKYLNPTTNYSYMKDFTVDLTKNTTANTGVKTTESGTLPESYSLHNEGDTYGISLTLEDAVGEETSGTILAIFDYYIYFIYDSTTSFSDSTLPSTKITIS